MQDHNVVSRADWIAERLDLLRKEKELTRLRDETSANRRELPWVLVEKDYVFEGPEGPVSLADLFDGRSQLIVQHFMFGPDWEEGCPMCSFWADNYDPTTIHLNQRDVTMVAISRGPFEKLQAYRERMGWSFLWVSSRENEFNFDFNVSFEAEQLEKGEVTYNYRDGGTSMQEAPGFSVFCKADDGTIYHTYSVYSRGLDPLNSAYQYLDLVPKGRDEAELPYGMAWVRRHDRYED